MWAVWDGWWVLRGLFLALVFWRRIWGHIWSPNGRTSELENVRFLYNCRQNRGLAEINKELNSDAFGVDFGSILRPL